MPKLDAAQLLTSVASRNDNRRRRATLVLGGLKLDADIDVPTLIGGLDSKNDDVVFWSEIALARLGERAAAAIPRLLRLLDRDPLFVRQAAVDALARVGPRDRAARAGVFGTFRHKDPDMRCEALQKCIDLPHPTAKELAAVAAMAKDPDPQVAKWRETALRNLQVRQNARTSASGPDTMQAPPPAPEGFDPDAFFAELKSRLGERNTFRSGFFRLLGWCAARQPHPDWKKVSGLDLASDERLAGLWLPSLLVRDRPDFPVHGLCFQLTEMANAKGEEYADLGAAFLGQYEPGDEDMLWLVGDRRHDPDESRFNGKVLKRAGLVFHRASGRGLGNDGYYPFALSFAAFLASSLMTPELHAWLGSPRHPVGVAAGWADGDNLLLGELTKRGFVPAR
ncbi:MAG TPA: HEAT repeat domain-containing protein [Opitutaceae bacterium]|nr:HEAT repeat domain-containing protein [Opitutaceae bacterium]